MKFTKRLAMYLLIALAVVAATLLSSCGQQADAGVIMREVKTDAEEMKSCSVSTTSSLKFTANGQQHSFQSSSKIDYHSSPFAMKSVQTSHSDGENSSSESYTVPENGTTDFYCRTSSGWQKTDAKDLDPSPFSQISIMQMLNQVQDQKYVRKTEVDSQKVHKIELHLKNEILRSTVENIVTASGMGENSKTIVQALLDSAPDIYGYCYINAGSGHLVRLELDAADEVNHIFQNIDGSTVKIKVSKCQICGNFSRIDNAPAVILPDGAKNASATQAKG